MGATTVLEFLNILLDFFCKLLAIAPVLIAIVRKKLPRNGGDEKSENPVSVPVSSNREPSPFSVFTQNLKGLSPGKRFLVNASIGLIFIAAAALVSFSYQIVQSFIQLVNTTVNTVNSVRLWAMGYSAEASSDASQAADPFLIPIAFLLVLGVLVLVLALAFFLAEAIFYIAAGVDIFYDEKSERLRLSKCGIACDVVSIAVLLFAASGKLPGDWGLLGPILFIALVVGFYNYFHYRRNKVADCSANTR